MIQYILNLYSTKSRVALYGKNAALVDPDSKNTVKTWNRKSQPWLSKHFLQTNSNPPFWDRPEIVYFLYNNRDAPDADFAGYPIVTKIVPM